MTGIMAGTNMSGVLKRPELSIPRGELSALACCLLTYSVVVLALGSAVPRDTLKDEYLVLSEVRRCGALRGLACASLAPLSFCGF